MTSDNQIREYLFAAKGIFGLFKSTTLAFSPLALAFLIAAREISQHSVENPSVFSF